MIFHKIFSFLLITLFFSYLNLTTAATKERKANAEYYSLQQEVKLSHFQIIRTQNEGLYKKKLLNDTTLEMSDLNEELKKRKKSTRLYAIFFYFTSQISIIEYIRAEGFSSLIDLAQWLLKKSLVHMDTIQKKRAKLTQLEFQLHNDILELDKKKNELKRAEKKLSRKESKVLKLLKAMKEKSYTKENEQDFLQAKGALKHPVSSSCLHQDFSLEHDPTFKVHRPHKGYFYSCKNTTSPHPVHAVFSGTVVFAHNLPQYGKTLILQHGSNYYTVYSGLKSLELKVGHSVKTGQIMGTIGYSHFYSKYGVYFELRRYTDAINPQNWLIPKKS